jgi:selenocysteine-specific elongation factor
MFVIGTAGHIDHGKSSIIIRLTGIDPDRLPEEKERGMTIDIGFAWYDTPDQKRIGIIDVPGHERFIRNMIAGAGGVDAVILVIAADDGWMPQSREHLQIAELLGVKYGIVALSKIDLVEKNWVDLVEDDIRDKLKGTFLENAPIVRFSSETGEGFDELKEQINVLSQKVIVREDIAKPRLYIDRSFVLAGMGGVIAGTLRGGRLKVGQEVAVFPSRRVGRVRTMQSHNQQIDEALPGQRTSISLTGIDKDFLLRGAVITSPEIINDYPDNGMLSLSVSLIPESKISLTDRRKLLMILGTTEVEGEIRTFDNETISPGGNGIVFFKPFEPVLSFIGDRCILRLPTPQLTIGGGSVLDIIDGFPRKKDMSKFVYLKDRVDLTPEILIVTELANTFFIDKKKDFIRCNYSQGTIDNVIDSLIRQSKLDEYNGRYYLSENVNPIIDHIQLSIKDYLDIRPHLDGLSIDIIADRSGYSVKNLETLLELMCNKGLLVKKGNRFDLAGRIVSVKGEIKMAADSIEKKLLKGEFNPPAIKELLSDNEVDREALDFLIVSGRTVKIGTNLVFHIDKWDEILQTVRSILDKNKNLTVAALREKLDSSRKYIIPILEETDRLKITTREGDVRIKGESFEKE